MADFGTSFAQGFQNMTNLLHNKQLMKQRQQELNLRNKLLDMQLEQYRQKLQSGQTLRELLGRQEPGPAEMTPRTEAGPAFDLGENPEAAGIMPPLRPGPMRPREPTRSELAQALIGGVEPLDIANFLEAGEKTTTAEPGRAIIGPGGTIRGFVPHAPGTSPQEILESTITNMPRLLRSIGGGPSISMPEAAPRATTVPMPQVEGEPGAAVRQVEPPAGAARPAVEFQGFTLDPGTGKLNLKFGQNELEVKDSNVETTPGSGIFVHRRDMIDKRTGGTVGSQIMGRATTGEGVQRVESIVRSWGLNPLTPLGQAAVGDVFHALAYQGAEEQNIAMERVRESVLGLQARGAGGTGPRGASGSVLEAARGERAARVKAETRAREEGQRTAGKMSDQDRIAFQTQSTILANIQYIEDTFTDKEIRGFVGLLNRPLQEAQMTARSISGKTGSERFAEFKAANERMRASAFGEGGKQLTTFEASVVFGYTPTGRETGGATEYLAKMRNLKAVTTMARVLRLELARTGAEDIDPAELDKRLREGMKKAGLARPPKSAPVQIEGAPIKGPLEIRSITPVR